MKVAITGGAGFIGCNAAEYYSKRGNEVFVFDNLSRRGSESNLKFLKANYPDNIKFCKGDITNPELNNKLKETLSGSDLILHLAAQVAVTTSVKDPREDFQINNLGTFNVLETVRELKEKNGENPTLIYASTNKVYGGMEEIKIGEGQSSYHYEDLPKVISEKQNLDFHSPYGCSKGAGDQYVRDYHRIYGLDTIVMRQSCIYGRRQFGVEDQGWVAWFTIANALKKPITIFGDGKQVRDVLWVDDLINAYEMARKNIDKTKGQCYNVGGGSNNKMSLLKLVSQLEDLSKRKMEVSYDDWRPGDQKVCIMDIGKAKRDFGWEPSVNPQQGVNKLYGWVNDNLEEVSYFFK